MNTIECQKKNSVLIVDDQSENIHALDNIIKEEYDTQAATSGVRALEIASGNNPPDMILLDIVMPEMDGYEVCRRLKADEQTRDIPVIFVTARNSAEDEEYGFNLGAADYISKPFQPAVVQVRVKSQMERKLAEKRLIEAARLREDVERITRHDLKTPLNAIIGFPRVMMMDDNISAEQLKYLEMIEESGLIMLNMINLSLDMFRMERGMYQFEPVPVNVLQVIRKVVDDTESLATMNNLSVAILISGEPAGSEESFSVQGETLLCYSMLANLIRNAFEASPAGERITVELTEEEEISVISIHNRGTVSQDVRDRFFDKYVTSGKKTGTGLGTYSARLIAEIHGGSIHVETSEEKGTTVTVRLPGKLPVAKDNQRPALIQEIYKPPEVQRQSAGKPSPHLCEIFEVTRFF
ncbi:MAG TPA: hybrid sensor histidine kinase/response regulator [Desulfobacterales bacterium]|nr:hybrid sensor histidine kinase/response regulator [Desulfobacterales bacterium]